MHPLKHRHATLLTGLYNAFPVIDTQTNTLTCTHINGCMFGRGLVSGLRTQAPLKQLGIKLLTFQLVCDLLSLLRHSCPKKTHFAVLIPIAPKRTYFSCWRWRRRPFLQVPWHSASSWLPTQSVASAEELSQEKSMMQMDISFSSMTTEVTDIKEIVTNRCDIGITRTLSGAMCGKSFPWGVLTRHALYILTQTTILPLT